MPDEEQTRILALVHPIPPAPEPIPAAPLPSPPLPLPVVELPRRPGRPRKTPGEGKHVTPVAGGRTPHTPPRGEGHLSDFSTSTKGIPTSQELLAATSQLLRRFHGKAITETGAYAKHAAVAFGVLVDKLTLLRSQAAQPVAADDAEQYREGVLRLAQRIAGILAKKS